MCEILRSCIDIAIFLSIFQFLIYSFQFFLKFSPIFRFSDFLPIFSIFFFNFSPTTVFYAFSNDVHSVLSNVHIFLFVYVLSVCVPSAVHSLDAIFAVYMQK